MGRRTREKPVGAVPDRVEKGSITGRGWGMGIGQTQDARVHVAASVPARMLSGTGRDGMCQGRYPLQRKWAVPASAGAQAALASSHCHRPAVPGTQTQAGMSALASQSLPS